MEGPNHNPNGEVPESGTPPADSALYLSAADYPTSAPQLSAAEFVPAPAVDFRDYFKCRVFDITKIQNLLDQPLSSNRSLLSRQRTELRDACDDTLAITNIWVSHPDDDHRSNTAGLCFWEAKYYWRTQFSSDENLSAWCELSPSQQTFLAVFASASWLAVCLYWQRLSRRLFNKLRQASKLLFALIQTPTFCGVSWSGREWFLLHGSHPPKPEHGPSADLSFGCALLLRTP